MGSENAADEQGVIGMDGTSQADRCFNPGERDGQPANRGGRGFCGARPARSQGNSHIGEWSWCALTVLEGEHLPRMSRETSECWDGTRERLRRMIWSLEAEVLGGYVPGPQAVATQSGGHPTMVASLTNPYPTPLSRVQDCPGYCPSHPTA